VSGEQNTAGGGHFAGIVIPQGATVDLNVHGLTVAEFEAMIAAALTNGLHAIAGRGWVTLKTAHGCEMSLFVPGGFPELASLAVWLDGERLRLSVDAPRVEILGGAS
jgi:hypothetical protein